MNKHSKESLFSITKKDFIIQTFRSGGKGGQNQNKVETGVRIKHPASGAVSESRTERSQFQNKKLAFKRLAEDPKFKIWLQKKAFETAEGKRNLEKEVDKWIKKQNLKIEVQEKGKWVTIET